MKELSFLSNNVESHIFERDRASSAGVQAVTHLSVVAHCDDTEILAYHGIQSCVQCEQSHFLNVVVTDGRGSPRGETTKGLSVEDYVELRKSEQLKACHLGKYWGQIFFGYESAKLQAESAKLISDLENLFKATRPQVIYTHSPFDKHKSHVLVFQNVLKALNRMEECELPESIFGCEVWRGQEWIESAVPLGFQASDLERDLISVYESQLEGGKDYVRATLGRRKSNATFCQMTEKDTFDHVTFAVDLKPLAAKKISLKSYLDREVGNLRDSIYSLNEIKGQ